LLQQKKDKINRDNAHAADECADGRTEALEVGT
jgi:hypothetical protein